MFIEVASFKLELFVLATDCLVGARVSDETRQVCHLLREFGINSRTQASYLGSEVCVGHNGSVPRSGSFVIAMDQGMTASRGVLLIYPVHFVHFIKPVCNLIYFIGCIPLCVDDTLRRKLPFDTPFIAT